KPTSWSPFDSEFCRASIAMKALNLVVANLPVLWDLYWHFWGFPRKLKAHRGVFKSFKDAAAICPAGKPLGYNQELIANHPDPAMLTARQEIGRFDPRDYPLLVWLARALEDSSNVFDLGGNVGLGWYAYRRFLRYPQTLRWLV